MSRLEPGGDAGVTTVADVGFAPAPRRVRKKAGVLTGAVAAMLLAAGGFFAWQHGSADLAHPLAPPPPPPQVTVSLPLQETVAASTGFLGQFSAVNAVELRAQVGGTLAEIHFADGQLVRSGDLLFVIDPRPYQIKLDQAVAQLQTSQARAMLAESELWRAQQLRRTDFGTAQSVDQRSAEQRSAQAAMAQAKAAIMDAQLDLDYSRIAAPFAGRVSAHRVSVGGLVSGSRAGSSPTTLLTTLVSLDPIYLDFDMSEADYLAYQRSHAQSAERLGSEVVISVDGGARFDRYGKLDFIDNAVNRSSGTIHARATVPNPDLSLTPGAFARLRLVTGKATPVLLVPAAAIVLDQSRELVMTVAADGTVVPKRVETGALERGLRVIRGGLAPGDSIVIDGLVRAQPGAKVSPVPGTIRPDDSGGQQG